jgi:hypothetical protein
MQKGGFSTSHTEEGHKRHCPRHNIIQKGKKVDLAPLIQKKGTKGTALSLYIPIRHKII